MEPDKERPAARDALETQCSMLRVESSSTSLTHLATSTSLQSTSRVLGSAITAAPQSGGRWLSASKVWDSVSASVAQQSEPSKPRRRVKALWAKLAAEVSSTVMLLRRDPGLLLLVLATFAVMIGLGTWAVWAGAESHAAFVRDTTSAAGSEILLFLSEQLASASYPTLALGMVRSVASCC